MHTRTDARMDADHFNSPWPKGGDNKSKLTLLNDYATYLFLVDPLIAVIAQRL